MVLGKWCHWENLSPFKVIVFGKIIQDSSQEVSLDRRRRAASCGKRALTILAGKIYIKGCSLAYHCPGKTCRHTANHRLKDYTFSGDNVSLEMTLLTLGQTYL